MASNTYNILSICSGVGGLDLAVGLAVENAVTVCHVEREAQAAAVLAARMEDGQLHEAPVWSDLSSFDGKPWRGLVDCIISGDPCQPNSVAGSQRGSEDDRFLIDELIRVVREVRPSRLFRENVTGNADGQLAALIPALEELGYSVAAGIFSAGEVGASHRRERLFIMADRQDVGHERSRTSRRGRNGFEDSGGDVADTKCSERRPRQSGGHVANRETAQRQEAASGIGKSGEDLANAQSRKRAMGEAERREPQEHIAGGSGELADALHAGPQGQQRGQHNSQGREKQDGPFGLHGRTRLPIFAPGPNDRSWPEILTGQAEVKPAIRGVVAGLAAILDEALNEAEQHTKKSATQYFFDWQEMCRMWLQKIITPSSRGLQQAAGGRDTLRDLSQQASSSPERSGMRGVQDDVSTLSQPPSYFVWRESLYRRAWQTLCGETMEQSFQRGSVCLLQNDIYPEAFAPEDLLALLREQAGMGTKKIKTDRLRAGGNGVCSMAGAIAWLSLANHFEQE